MISYKHVPEHEELRLLTRRFVERELMPHEQRVDDADAVDEELAERVRRRALEAGIYAFNMPAEVGGPGLSHVAQVLVREEIGRTSIALGDLIMRPPAMLLRASKEQRQRFLKPAVRGELRIAFALTEAAAGSDVSSMTTRAERCDGGYRVSGTKQFISNGSHADLVIVFARTGDPGGDPKIGAFVVARGSQGFAVTRTERKMGWRGYPVNELVFDQCFVADDDVIGEPGEGLSLALDQITEARLGVAAQCVGMGQHALDLAVDHARSRVQFGKPIGRHQGIRWMLAEMATRLEQARALLYAAAQAVDDGRDSRTAASMAKLAASEMATFVIDQALQIFGGSGYMTGAPVERMYRDIRAYRIGEGTSEIQKNQISRQLLGHLS